MQIQEAQLLLKKIANEDKDALMCFYRTFGGSIYKTSLRVLNDKSLAEDVLNEIIFKVYEKAGTLSQLKNPLGYICVMAYNRSIDYKRTHREIPVEEYVFGTRSNEYSGAESLEKIYIDGILESFDEPDRSIFILKASLGYTFHEIRTLLSLAELSYKQVRLKYEKTKTLFKKLYIEGNSHD